MSMQSNVLAYCRTGLDTEEIIAILSAITSRMGNDDPVCEVLDFANDKLMTMQEARRIRAIDAHEEEANQELWTADDAACKRGEAANTIINTWGQS